jgi:hypothetical protein
MKKEPNSTHIFYLDSLKLQQKKGGAAQSLKQFFSSPQGLLLSLQKRQMGSRTKNRAF